MGGQEIKDQMCLKMVMWHIEFTKNMQPKYT